MNPVAEVAAPGLVSCRPYTRRGSKRSTRHTHTHPDREQHPRHQHAHTHDKNNTPPPHEHLPQTLNHARRWRDDGACHLPRPNAPRVRKRPHPNIMSYNKTYKYIANQTIKLILQKKNEGHERVAGQKKRPQPNIMPYTI